LDLSIIQGPFSVAPCQTLANITIRNFFIAVRGCVCGAVPVGAGRHRAARARAVRGTGSRSTARRQARTGHQGGGTGRTAGAGACFVLRVGLLSPPTAPPPDDKHALATKAAAPGALLVRALF
jgi:hypothetical protein